MYRSFFILFFFGAFASAGYTQTYTLEQCIDSAIAFNIPVKQADLTAQSAKVNWQQSRANLLPFVSAEIDHGLYNGRTIDPFSNGYVNQSFNSASYGLSSGMTLFNGGSLVNNVKQYAAAYDASKMDWQQAKDNLVLNVILAYLQVLNNEDVLAASMKQAELSKNQIDRAEILNSQGAIKPSDLSDFKGQFMNDQLSIVNARNALETSKLTLAQLMNRFYSPAMKLERINVGEFLSGYTATSDQVYQNSLQQFSLVKAVELRKKSYAYGVKSARGNLFPLVSLGGGFSSNYSSIAQNTTGKIPYNDQLKNNLSNYVGLGISIPVFNRLQYRNRVKQAIITYKNSELTEENTKLQLRKDIDQAYLNMSNAYDRYKVLLEQVAAYTESFKAAEVRYNSGVGTSIDYLTAKDRLDRANINLISARYEFVLRKKVLDYYQNIIQ